MDGWKISNFFFIINDLIGRQHSPWTPSLGLPNSRWNWLTRSTSIFIFSMLVLWRTAFTRLLRRFWILYRFSSNSPWWSSSKQDFPVLALAHTEYIFRYTHELTSSSPTYFLLGYEDFVSNFLLSRTTAQLKLYGHLVHNIICDWWILLPLLHHNRFRIQSNTETHTGHDLLTILDCYCWFD